MVKRGITVARPRGAWETVFDGVARSAVVVAAHASRKAAG
jgi:hypothetical protein